MAVLGFDGLAVPLELVASRVPVPAYVYFDHITASNVAASRCLAIHFPMYDLACQ